MEIIKADGRKEPFSREKVIATCLMAGTSQNLAEEICDKIERENIRTTEDIYKKIITILDPDTETHIFFRLREAIAALGPKNFEIYVKELLEAEGYECKWNSIIKGSCVEHQVDLIAKKEYQMLVEIKQHVNPHRFCGLDVLLQVQARLEDINAGFVEKKNNSDFKGAWIITNTKFSEHAKMYAKGKGIKITGWGNDLENMIKKNNIIPVTVMNMKPEDLNKLFEQNIVTLKQLYNIRNTKAGVAESG